MLKDRSVRLLMELMEKALWSLSKLAGELGTVVAGLAAESELSDPETVTATAVGAGRFLTTSSEGAITLAQYHVLPVDEAWVVLEDRRRDFKSRKGADR